MMNSRLLIGPFGISVLALAVIVIAVLAQTPKVFGVLRVAPTEDIDAKSRIEELAARQSDEVRLDAERFEKRSVFFTPPRPPTPPPPRVETPDPGPPPIRPAPAAYGGSLKPLAILGDQVWFGDGPASSNTQTIKLGESRSGIRLVSIEAPWSVRVAWTAPGCEEGEYNLRIFETDGSGFRTGSTTSSTRSSFPGVTPAPPGTSAAPPSRSGDTSDALDPRDQESRS